MAFPRRYNIRPRTNLPPAPAEELDIYALTRQHVEAVVAEYGIEKSWRHLGIHRATLYRWLNEWDEMDKADKGKRGKGQGRGKREHRP